MSMANKKQNGSTIGGLIAWTIALFLAPLMVIGVAVIFAKLILPLVIELLKRLP